MKKKSWFILLSSTDIVCFFAAKGFWPFYPPILQYQVSEMGKKVFSLSDDRIRQFCRGKFNFQETCYRPGEFANQKFIVNEWICSQTPTNVTFVSDNYFFSSLQRLFCAASRCSSNGMCNDGQISGQQWSRRWRNDNNHNNNTNASTIVGYTGPDSIKQK